MRLAGEDFLRHIQSDRYAKAFTRKLLGKRLTPLQRKDLDVVRVANGQPVPYYLDPTCHRKSVPMEVFDGLVVKFGMDWDELRAEMGRLLNPKLPS
jgi:hypothetical protein